jgi:hypothetical protein
VKWCLTWYRDFGSEMVVEESIKLHVLHLQPGMGACHFVMTNPVIGGFMN